MNTGMSALRFLLLLVLLTGCGNPVWLAHSFNEKGISRYNKKEFGTASGYFEKSIAQKFKEEVPVYNLGNNYYMQGNYTLAHSYYERAIVLKPDMVEALFNDGHSLYMWGRSQLDKNFCNIKRTLELWEKSVKRFREVIETAGASAEYGVKAEVISDLITEQMGFIRAKHEENKELCKGKGGGGKSRKDKKDEKDKERGSDKDKSSGDKDKKPGALSGGSRGEGTKVPEGLSRLEKETVKSALKRIKRNAGKFRFNQSKSQQIRKGEGKPDTGGIISW
jgi:tetratricopeptide (TPR) repeat protein